MQMRVWKLGNEGVPAEESDVPKFKKVLEEALKNPSSDGNIDIVWKGEVSLHESMIHNASTSQTFGGGIISSPASIAVQGVTFSGLNTPTQENTTSEKPKPKLRMANEG